MSSIIFEDLHQDRSLDALARAAIRGGHSYPVEPGHGPGGFHPVPELYMPIDVDTLKQEILDAWRALPWGPVPMPGDPTEGPY